MSLITTGYHSATGTPMYASGGTITTLNGYAIHTFIGTANFIAPDSNLTDVSFLIIAGGGGGGNGTTAGAGGGAGGYIYVTGQTITKNTNLGVFVGEGGAVNTNGSNSTFNGYTAIGGGCGASSGSVRAGNGGSGGGTAGTLYAPGNGTTGQGYRGGYAVASPIGFGGGGGASQVGLDGTAGVGGNGGNGITNSITGSPVNYCGGGGGRGASTNGQGVYGGGNVYFAGTDGTGGGGGAGAKGGNGVIIIKYKIENRIDYKTRNVFRIGTGLLDIDFSPFVGISASWGTVNYAENFTFNVYLLNYKFSNKFYVRAYCPTDVNYDSTSSIQTLAKGETYTWGLVDKFGGDSVTGYRTVIVQAYTEYGILITSRTFSVWMNGTPSLGTLQTADPTVYGDYSVIGTNLVTINVSKDWINVGQSTAYNCRLNNTCSVIALDGSKQHAVQIGTGQDGPLSNIGAGQTVTKTNSYEISAWRDVGGISPVRITMDFECEYQKVAGGALYNGGNYTYCFALNVS